MIKKILNKLAEYPRLRILVFLILIILVLFIISRMFSSSVNPPVPPSSITNGPVTLSQPALNASQYQQLASEAKQNKIQQAASSGQSFFDGVFNNSNNGSTNADGNTSITPTPASNVGSGASPAVAANLAGAKNQPPAVNPQSFYQQEVQQANLGQLAANAPQGSVYNIGGGVPTNSYNQQDDYNRKLQQQTQNMNQQLQTLSNSWKLPTASLVQGAVDTTTNTSATSTVAGPVAIKAGSVLYAVLETALNSDQAGTPVMATIVTGKYKGAKLLGSFARENDALVLQFTQMSMDSLPASIGIQAYAIDGQTAQNALASNVDNHYLLRYGSVFAAGFLQGFGNAYNPNANSSPCAGVGAGGTCNVTYSNNTPTPATQTAVYQGFGQVGTNLSSAMMNNFNTPPTVTLNQGVGMGILFMQDVRIQ